MKQPHRSTTVATLLGAAVLCSACASPARPGAPTDPTRGSRGTAAAGPTAAVSGAAAGVLNAAATLEGESAVAIVAGEPLLVSELLSAWWQRDSLAASEALHQVVATRLASIEARRLGITVPTEVANQRFADAQRAMGEAVARGGSGLGLEDYMRLRLGVDPDTYLERVRRDAIDELMAERVVRSWLLASPRADVRVIVTLDGAKMEEVRAALVDGQDFAELARRYSVDGSSGDGGLIPPIVRDEHSSLSSLAFATPVGEVGGPLVEGGTQLLIQVLDRPEVQVGAWDRMGPVVEQSLEERPVENNEFLQWKLRMEREYEVDLTPFFRLVGEPMG